MIESKKLNILLLTDGIYPYVMGGMQKHSYVIAKLFAKNNHKVTLYHCGHFGQSEFNEDYEKVFTPKELKNIKLKFVPFTDSGKLPGHYIKANKLYAQKLKNEIGANIVNYDIIYAQGLTGFSFLNNPNQIPLVVNLHGFEMYQKAVNLKIKLEHYLLRPIVKKIITKADYILSFGGKIDQILNDLKVDPSKIIQQSNGIEKDWLTENKITTKPTITFTFIGRYERRKGIEELTEVLKKLNIKLNYKFNFIGPIPENHQIISSKIKYFGEIKDQAKIKSILDESDFLVSPSYAEGMPTVMLEAMTRGNAVIATDVGANSQLILNKAWLIKPNTESLKSAIEKAIDLSKSDLLDLKNQNLALVKSKYIWEVVIQNKIVELERIVVANKLKFL